MSEVVAMTLGALREWAYYVALGIMLVGSGIIALLLVVAVPMAIFERLGDAMRPREEAFWARHPTWRRPCDRVLAALIFTTLVAFVALVGRACSRGGTP